MSGLGNKAIMAKNICKFMETHGLKRADLANILDVPYPTVSDWINAKTYPRIDKIEMMANYFNISKSDLVEDKKITRPLLSERVTKLIEGDESFRDIVELMSLMDSETLVSLKHIAREIISKRDQQTR
jgi:transcriptional regulator with XRE-family HTH domain